MFLPISLPMVLAHGGSDAGRVNLLLGAFGAPDVVEIWKKRRARPWSMLIASAPP